MTISWTQKKDRQLLLCMGGWEIHDCIDKKRGAGDFRLCRAGAVKKEDAAVYSYILSQCAESAGMDTKQLEKMSYRYIISEVDYPKTFYRIVKLRCIWHLQ